MVPIIRISPSASGARWSTGTPFTCTPFLEKVSVTIQPSFFLAITA